MTTKTPSAADLSARILEFIATAVDCLDNTNFANDRPVYTQDLAVAARWLVRLHRGESVREVAQTISSAASGKILTDYYRQGEWGKKHNAAVAVLQAAASAFTV